MKALSHKRTLDFRAEEAARQQTYSKFCPLLMKKTARLFNAQSRQKQFFGLVMLVGIVFDLLFLKHSSH
jgi:hypothetical protein